MTSLKFCIWIDYFCWPYAMCCPMKGIFVLFFLCTVLIIWFTLDYEFQVVLPFVKKYYHAHKDYFVCQTGSSSSSSMASVKEKEMTARSVSHLDRACTLKHIHIKVVLKHVLVQFTLKQFISRDFYFPVTAKW